MAYKYVYTKKVFDIDLSSIVCDFENVAHSKQTVDNTFHFVFLFNVAYDNRYKFDKSKKHTFSKYL